MTVRFVCDACGTVGDAIAPNLGQTRPAHWWKEVSLPGRPGFHVCGKKACEVLWEEIRKDEKLKPPPGGGP